MSEPEFLRALERFTEEMSRIDEVAHVLLKGHLILEEQLVSIIEQYAFQRDHVQEARLSFTQKLAVARSFCLRKNTHGEWELIGALNALRNDIAHNLNSTKRASKLARVKELYFKEAAEYPKIEEVKKASDAEIVFHACAHCSGYLSSFADDSKAFRRVIYKLDREMNPSAPAFDL